MMRCPTCESQGLTSRINIGLATADRAELPKTPQRYVTAKGVLHLHDPTITVQHYSCSQGHEWEYRDQNKCPAGDYP